jgi:hypothetical protein
LRAVDRFAPPDDVLRDRELADRLDVERERLPLELFAAVRPRELLELFEREPLELRRPLPRGDVPCVAAFWSLSASR